MSKSFKSNDLQDSKNQQQAFVFAGNKDLTPDGFNVKEINSSSDAIFKLKTGKTQISSGSAFVDFEGKGIKNNLQ